MKGERCYRFENACIGGRTKLPAKDFVFCRTTSLACPISQMYFKGLRRRWRTAHLDDHRCHKSVLLSNRETLIPIPVVVPENLAPCTRKRRMVDIDRCRDEATRTFWTVGFISGYKHYLLEVALGPARISTDERLRRSRKRFSLHKPSHIRPLHYPSSPSEEESMISGISESLSSASFWIGAMP